MDNLRIALLGAPAAWWAGRPIDFPTRKTLALLAYLVAEPNAHARSTLAALFWPESDDERAHAALRRTLARLKSAIGGGHLAADRDTLRFLPDTGTDLDLRAVSTAWEIARAAEPLAPPRVAALQEAIALDRGPFLDGLALPDAPGFEEWAEPRRQTWSHRVKLILGRLATWQADTGDLAAALDTALRWVAHDPYDEGARLRLIQLQLARGDRVGALRAYENYHQILADELGAEPDEELAALARTLRAPPAKHPTQSARRISGQPPGRLPLVGRAEEHRHLVAALRALERGGPGVVVVEGDAGIGKSRLIQEFLGWADGAADLVVGRAFEVGNPIPYQPIVEGLRERLAREPDPRALLSKVWLAELSRLLPELSDRIPEVQPPRPSALPEASLRFFEAVARLGAALAAPRPLVVAVDDLHWADTSTRDLLRYGLRAWTAGHARILLLLTVRSEEIRPGSALAVWLDGIARECPVTRVALAPLGSGDTRRLIQATFPEQPVDRIQTMARRLFGATGGHPLFLVETLRHLKEGGDDVHLAPGVRAAIRARLDRLDGHERRALGAGAVLGAGFTADVLRDVGDLDESELVGALEELLARRLLRVTNGRYDFSHDVVRQVAYDETSEPRRRALHCRAVAALDAVRAPAAERLRHARLGGMPTRSFHLALAAGDEAFAALAARRAVEYYELARSLGETDPTLAPADREHLYRRLGRAYELSDR
ncbi:MAG TPA: AAA family ATPase, partial [Chloroflexota bacterium]|nr:AAA family ATPase [Chloroflexota bacterium]